jgi:hypothetical protein
MKTQPITAKEIAILWGLIWNFLNFDSLDSKKKDELMSQYNINSSKESDQQLQDALKNNIEVYLSQTQNISGILTTKFQDGQNNTIFLFEHIISWLKTKFSIDLKEEKKQKEEKKLKLKWITAALFIFDLLKSHDIINCNLIYKKPVNNDDLSTQVSLVEISKMMQDLIYEINRFLSLQQKKGIKLLIPLIESISEFLLTIDIDILNDNKQNTQINVGDFIYNFFEMIQRIFNQGLVIYILPFLNPIEKKEISIHDLKRFEETFKSAMLQDGNLKPFKKRENEYKSMSEKLVRKLQFNEMILIWIKMLSALQPASEPNSRSEFNSDEYIQLFQCIDDFIYNVFKKFIDKKESPFESYGTTQEKLEYIFSIVLYVLSKKISISEFSKFINEVNSNIKSVVGHDWYKVEKNELNKHIERLKVTIKEKSEQYAQVAKKSLDVIIKHKKLSVEINEAAQTICKQMIGGNISNQTLESKQMLDNKTIDIRPAVQKNVSVKLYAMLKDFVPHNELPVALLDNISNVVECTQFQEMHQLSGVATDGFEPVETR